MTVYELHCHTSGASWCGKIRPEDQVDCYKKMGYAGLFLTEHFPLVSKFAIEEWDDKVSFFEQSFKRAETRGKKVGLQVFFAFEYGYKGTHILVYGLGPDWLRAHPEIPRLRVEEFMQLAHDDGAFLVHAHPFLRESFVSAIRLVPWLTDAVEVINPDCAGFGNDEARHYAEAFGLKMTAGTDNHTGFRPQMLGVRVEKPVRDAAELIELLRTGAYSIWEGTSEGVSEETK